MKKAGQQKFAQLKKYFQEQPEALLVFVFGSVERGAAGQDSDWDIGVYFIPKDYSELESSILEYPQENKIRSRVIDILETDNVDFVVLNRARPSLVYNVLRAGAPVVVRDKKLYFDLLCKAGYEATDWWHFVDSFYNIRAGAKSLTPEARAKVQERLVFLEEQFSDIGRLKKLSWLKYRDNRSARRDIERWVENLVVAAIDIAKIILAAHKKEIPQSYKDTLKLFGALYIDEKLADQFGEFAKLRNIVVHIYLDIQWAMIQDFITAAERIYPKLIEKVKEILVK